MNELAGVASAYARDGWAAEFEVRTNFANIIGGDEALAELQTPDPADMTTDRVATLIEDIITEIRNHIAAGN